MYRSNRCRKCSRILRYNFNLAMISAMNNFLTWTSYWSNRNNKVRRCNIIINNNWIPRTSKLNSNPNDISSTITPNRET